MLSPRYNPDDMGICDYNPKVGFDYFTQKIKNFPPRKVPTWGPLCPLVTNNSQHRTGWLAVNPTALALNLAASSLGGWFYAEVALPSTPGLTCLPLAKLGSTPQGVCDMPVEGHRRVRRWRELKNETCTGGTPQLMKPGLPPNVSALSTNFLSYLD